MKLKYYLRGLGVGVICTAIIMGIALSGNKKEKLTDAEIIERARLLGMVMEEDSGGKSSEKKETESLQNEENKTPENQESKEKEKETSDKKEEKNDDGTSDSAKSEDEKQEGTSDNNNSAAEDGQVSNGTQNMVEFEIKQGEFSDVVSRKLFEAGLIPNAEDFNTYMTQKGVDDSLRVGVHMIPAGATADEIIEILQGKPQ